MWGSDISLATFVSFLCMPYRPVYATIPLRVPSDSCGTDNSHGPSPDRRMRVVSLVSACGGGAIFFPPHIHPDGAKNVPIKPPGIPVLALQYVTSAAFSHDNYHNAPAMTVLKPSDLPSIRRRSTFSSPGHLQPLQPLVIMVQYCTLPPLKAETYAIRLPK